MSKLNGLGRTDSVVLPSYQIVFHGLYNLCCHVG